MAFPVKAVLGLSVAALGLAALSGGKKTTSSSRTGRPNKGAPGQVKLPTQMAAWCKSLHKGDNLQAKQKIAQEVIAVDAATPPWDKAQLSDARERAFAITSQVIENLCPGVPLPAALYNVPNYIATKPAWWGALYNLVHGQAWHLTTGA